MKEELDRAYLKQKGAEYYKRSFLEAIDVVKDVQTPQLGQLGIDLPEDREEALDVLRQEKEERLKMKEELKRKKKALLEAQAEVRKINTQLAAVPQLLNAAQSASAALQRHFNLTESQENHTEQPSEQRSE